jgi:ATP-dependent protease ClpP protease subunit
MRIRNVLLAALMMGTPSIQAREFTPDNTVVIDREITRETMVTVMASMEALLVADRAPSELNIILNSPGGSVNAGLQFVGKMHDLQGRGTKLNCIVTGLAASMAFHILTQCDTRTVMAESFLLWHRVRTVIQGIVTGPQAADLAYELAVLDKDIFTALHASLGKDMTDNAILFHFNRESLHLGSDLHAMAPKFCKAVTHIPGLSKALENPEIAHAVPSMRMGLSPQESMIYIWSLFISDTTNGGK